MSGGSPFTRLEQEHVDELVRKAILPYRVRFYLILSAVLATMLIAFYSAVHSHQELQDAINRVTCSERALVLHATPATPRAITSADKRLHYTQTQKIQILALRAYLLKALPPATCPPRHHGLL